MLISAGIEEDILSTEKREDHVFPRDGDSERMKEDRIHKAVVIAEKGLSFEIVERSQLFPPLDILNTFLQCGIDDAASEISIQWEPFCLTDREYDRFVEHCKAAIGQFKVDDLGKSDYANWFSEAVLRQICEEGEDEGSRQ